MTPVDEMNPSDRLHSHYESSDMLPINPRIRLSVFSTCPPSKDISARDYFHRVAEVARWSEHAGCKGILVYADNGLCDPWIVSEVILRHTTTLCPLVAVQP